jgi:hypothetical protein
VNLGVSGTTLSLRAFQGDYDVVVRRGGVPVQQQTFHLGTQPLTWTLDVTDSTGGHLVGFPVTGSVTQMSIVLVNYCVSFQ